jgi:hypothetical protein
MRAAAERTTARALRAALLAILLLGGAARADAAEQDVTGITIDATLSAAEIQQVIAEVRRIDASPILFIVDASKGGRLGAFAEGTHLAVMMGMPEPGGAAATSDAPESSDVPGTTVAPETPDAAEPTIHLLERQGGRWIVIKTAKLGC